MLPDIDKLLELQLADKEIRKLQDEVAALPKRVAVIEQKLAGTNAQLEKARNTAKGDRKSTRLNSSHQIISYAVFCLKKKKKPEQSSKENLNAEPLKPNERTLLAL